MHSPNIYRNCEKSILKGKIKNNIYYLNKKSFNKITPKSFDYAILEKNKKIYSIKLNIQWSDLGNWREISKMYLQNRNKYFDKKNIYYRPWGKYINLFEGKGFLIKELYIKPNASISLQKHNYRSEHWMIVDGKPKITINKKIFFINSNESVFIPRKSIHRIQNIFKKDVKIIEVQLGSILKESDIIRYQDIYGRTK